MVSGVWDWITDTGGDAWDWATDTGGDVWDWATNTGGAIGDFLNTPGGEAVGTGLIGLGLNIAKNKGFGEADIKPTGYQGGIPDMVYNREMLNIPNDPNRRPGQAGRRYFTDGEFTTNGVMQGIQSLAPEAQAGQVTDMDGRPVVDDGNPVAGGGGGGGGGGDNTQLSQFAMGGIAQLPINRYARGGQAGRYLRGETDGMSDEILTTIDGQQPAALSHGEFVIPADIVSHLGNGNSEAGAKMLEQMMSRVRTERTGNSKQGKEIDANQFLPQ